MTGIPDLSSDEEQFKEEEWTEMATDYPPVRCLFCESEFPDVEKALAHCDAQHGFDLPALRTRHGMDDYSFIKLVNYIKTHNPSSEVIMGAQTAIWDDDAYLKPVGDDDWLMFDFESFERSDSQSMQGVKENGGVVMFTEEKLVELQNTIQDLKAQVCEKANLLNLAYEDIEKMKRSMHTLVDGVGSVSGEQEQMNSVAKVALEDDQGYFNSYAHFSIHHTMLSDKVRTDSYRDAILKNKSILNDSVVLDLGCGTGILSMFAATAGAKTVYALDMSDIVYHAMDIIRENNLHETIKVIKGRLENTKLEQKVDVIVSEWMGYFLLFEGMLDSVIYARDHYLKPGGKLFPNRCNISIVGGGDIAAHNSLIAFWSDVYGYKMNCMKTEVVREASIEVVDSKHVITEPCIVTSIDINTCTTDVMDFSSEFSLVVTKNGTLTCLIGYFDTYFDLPSPVEFSTGPHTTPTHWKQTVFYFKDLNEVKVGDVITGKIICSRSVNDVRALSVQIELFGKVYKFILS